MTLTMLWHGLVMGCKFVAVVAACWFAVHIVLNLKEYRRSRVLPFDDWLEGQADMAVRAPTVVNLQERRQQLNAAATLPRVH